MTDPAPIVEPPNDPPSHELPDNLDVLVEEVLEAVVRPELRDEGSDVELVGIDEGDVVLLRFVGACQGCDPNVLYHLTMRAEAAIKNQIPAVRLVEAVS